MRHPSPIFSLTREERAQLAYWLRRNGNELLIHLQCRDYSDYGAAYWGDVERQAERAGLDIKDVENEQMPVTRARLERYVRDLRDLPNVANMDEKRGEFLAFMERMRHYCRRSREAQGAQFAATRESADAR